MPCCEEMIVYYDLETGGLGPHDDIVQIGAVSSSGVTFSQYVRPVRGISEGATDIHGLENDSDMELYRDDEWVESVSLTRAMRDFCDYLEDFHCRRADCRQRCHLVAHNGNRFDHLHLAAAASMTRTQGRLEDLVHGFGDTLPILRRRFGTSRSLNLHSLAEDYLGQRQCHDALDDAQILKSVAHRLSIPKATLLAENKWFFKPQQQRSRCPAPQQQQAAGPYYCPYFTVLPPPPPALPLLPSLWPFNSHSVMAAPAPAPAPATTPAPALPVPSASPTPTAYVPAFTVVHECTARIGYARLTF